MSSYRVIDDETADDVYQSINRARALPAVRGGF